MVAINGAFGATPHRITPMPAAARASQAAFTDSGFASELARVAAANTAPMHRVIATAVAATPARPLLVTRKGPVAKGTGKFRDDRAHSFAAHSWVELAL